MIILNVFGYYTLFTFFPALGEFKNGGQLGGKDLKVKATLGSQVNLTCPDHTEGEGQLYYWGELPDQGKPVLWGNGDEQPLAFIGEHGELIFSYLTQEHVTKINQLGGISCILYQLQAARSSIRISIETDGEGNLQVLLNQLDYVRLFIFQRLDTKYRRFCEKE